MDGLRILLFISISLHVSLCSEDPVVEIQQGKLRGSVFTSARSQRQYFGFTGIPYAKAPLGNLRFKAPQSPDPWTGVWDATSERNSCIQISFVNRMYEGNEDCLYVNVYTPQLQTLSRDLALMPVMVYFHCGGFTFGSGNRKLQGPDYLVDAGVVFVTLNYRLGPFGFLSLESKEAPGNAGLKDQVMALRWVHQNIAMFGGDPNSITIFGHNAGGASVQYHMLSPLSQGLFHRAISQSGSALCPWAYTKVGRTVALKLSQLLGWNATKNDAETLQFLQSIPPEKIFEMSTGNLLPEEERDPLGFSLPFVPTKENIYEGGEEVFLPDEPEQLISQGKVTQVPYVTGVCSHDGYLIYLVSEKNDIKLDQLDGNPSELVLPAFHSRTNLHDIIDIGNRIKKFYFGNTSISNQTLQQFVKFASDVYFKFPSYQSMQLQTGSSTSPVYFFQFNYVGRYGFRKARAGFADFPGAFHGEELGYMFSVETLNDLKLREEEPEVQMVHKVVKMWTDFAKTGNPTPDSALNIQWLPYTRESHNYLLIDKDLTMETDLDTEQMHFWEDLKSSSHFRL